MKLLEKLGHRSRIVAVAVALGGIISAGFAAFGNAAVPLAFGSVCLAVNVCFGLLERSGNRESTKAQRRHLLLLTSVAGKIDKVLTAGQAHKRGLHGLGVSADKVNKDLGVLNKELSLIAGKLDTVLEIDAGLTEDLETVRGQQTTAMKESKSRQAVLYADMGRLMESQERVLRRLDAVRSDQKTDGLLLSAAHDTISLTSRENEDELKRLMGRVDNISRQINEQSLKYIALRDALADFRVDFHEINELSQTSLKTLTEVVTGAASQPAPNELTAELDSREASQRP